MKSRNNKQNLSRPRTLHYVTQKEESKVKEEIQHKKDKNQSQRSSPVKNQLKIFNGFVFFIENNKKNSRIKISKELKEDVENQIINAGGTITDSRNDQSVTHILVLSSEDKMPQKINNISYVTQDWLKQ